MTLGQNIWLQRPSEDTPWGFRIGGGRDYKEPIKIQRVTAGSIASRELSTGDLVLRIGHEDTAHLTQAQANDLIKHGGNVLQLGVSKSGGSAACNSYTPYTSHTPVTPGTPGQVAPSNQHHGLSPSSGRMHDLFDDMYRQSDYQQQPPPSRGSNNDNSYNRDKQPFQAKPSSQPYNYSANESSGGITKINNEIIGPFFPSESDYPNQNGHFKSYKPDTSLNSSTDSGFSYGQASHKIGSPTYPNTPASMSSSISELSDMSYGQSQDSHSGTYVGNTSYDDFPSPPPPLSSTNIPFGSPHVKSPSSCLPTPPVLPSSEPPKPWKPTTPSSEEGPVEPRTRLEQQLAELNMSGYMSPTASYPNTPQTYHSPNAAPGAPGYHPLAGVPPPPPPVPSSQPMSPYRAGGSPYSAGPSPPSNKTSPAVADRSQMPDKVLNMAAKSGSDKKPFSYVPDMGSLAEQRDKVRRRPGAIPAYQNMLNLPNFNDPPVAPHLKKRVPEQVQPEPDLPAGPGEGNFVHAQYNSPLQLYSNDAVEAAFQGQTGGVVTAASRGGQKQDGDITQSETYKMIHGLDQPKKRPTVTIPAQNRSRPPRGPTGDDEMTFSGVNNRNTEEIPSKAFQRLQSLTGGAEIDTTSIRPKQDDGQDEVIGGYDEASIRYMGRNIPSRSFRMLQSLTGGPDMGAPTAAPKRRPHRKQDVDAPVLPHGKDDIASMSYVGGNIPSKSFRMLQQSIGEPESSQLETAQCTVEEHTADDQPVQSVSEIPGGPPTTPLQGAADGRRQRRRQRNREIQHQTSDIGPTNVHNSNVVGTANQTPSSEADNDQQHDWDESAYLRGMVPLMGGQPKIISPKHKKAKEKAPWERDNVDFTRQDIFAEDKFRKKEVEKEVAPWETRRRDSYPEESPTILSSVTHGKANEVPQTVEQAEEKEHDTEFDEQAFLAGRVPLVTGDASRAEPAAATPQKKPKKYRERAPWEKPDSDDEDSGVFAESDYLAGKITLVGNKDGQQTSEPPGGRFSRIPSRTFNKLRRSISRDGSPGSRGDSMCSADYTSTEESERSESEEPYKNLVYVGKSIPSKTFNKLRRSMDRRASQDKPPTADDFERLRQETRDLEGLSRQVENVQIHPTQPEEYLENLKESMQRNGVRIEEAEATDF